MVSEFFFSFSLKIGSHISWAGPELAFVAYDDIELLARFHLLGSGYGWYVQRKHTESMLAREARVLHTRHSAELHASLHPI